MIHDPRWRYYWGWKWNFGFLSSQNSKTKQFQFNVVYCIHKCHHCSYHIICMYSLFGWLNETKPTQSNGRTEWLMWCNWKCSFNKIQTRDTWNGFSHETAASHSEYWISIDARLCRFNEYIINHFWPINQIENPYRVHAKIHLYNFWMNCNATLVTDNLKLYTHLSTIHTHTQHTKQTLYYGAIGINKLIDVW